MPLIEDLRIESSNATFNALPLLDFTGGLNLGREGFLLQDNESPDMLNVDVLAEGGVCRRTPLRPMHASELPSPVVHIAQHKSIWRNEFYLSLEDGTVQRLRPWSGALPDTTWIPTATAGHPWRFIQALDVLYGFNGVDNPIAVNGDVVTSLGTDWNDEVEGSDPLIEGYEDPVGGNMPIGSKAAFFQGRLWLADITYPAFTQPLSDRVLGQDIIEAPVPPGEASPAGLNTGEVFRPNRIHLSFPIQGETGPEDWNSYDWFDVDDGANGDRITALVPCGDIMYIFKEHSVYAAQLSADGTPNYTRIYDRNGTPSSDSVVCYENIVYFWDVETGVNAINPALSANETNGIVGNLSQKLLPMLRSGLPIAASRAVKLGWSDRRLYVSMPTQGETYVLDPNMSTKPWMLYDYEVGSFFSYEALDEEAYHVAASTRGNYLLEIDGRDVPETSYDDYGGSDLKLIASHYRTNWFGSAASAVTNPFSSKEWIGLDVVGEGSDLSVEFYADQDETKYWGVADLNFAAPVVVDLIELDLYQFPVTNLVNPGLGRDLIGDPCQTYPADTPRFARPEGQATFLSKCVGLPARSASLQLKFIGGSEDWCIGSLLLQFREYAPLKTGYEATT